MKRLIGILQFMTRLPIRVDVGFDEAFHKGMVYFPIVGLILGICYEIVARVGSLFFEPYVVTILVICSEVILTGGLHLDGLGDTFDGLYSYRDKDRILEIMKDSRLGTNGLLAIMLVLMLKAGMIYEIVHERELFWLIIMPTVARWMQVFACYKAKTPREKGMGNLFIGKVTPKMLVISSVLLIGVILGTIGMHEVFSGDGYYGYYIAQASLSFLILILFVLGFIRSVYRKIDGITGDILGAICELSELGFLMMIHLVTRFI